MHLDDLPLISADSHVEEPSRLWREQLTPAMAEALPEELGPDFHAAAQFARRIGVEDFFDTKGVSDAASEAGARDLDNLRELTVDVERRFEIMRRDGISGECIYPTAGLYVWNIADPALGEACCRSYNDWIHERLESRSPRFRCAAMIPTWSVEAAVREVERIAALGLASAMVALVGTPEYNHRQWEPLWNAIEAARLPVVMHQGSGHDMLFYRGPGAAVSNLLATQSMAPRTVSSVTGLSNCTIRIVPPEKSMPSASRPCIDATTPARMISSDRPTAGQRHLRKSKFGFLKIGIPVEPSMTSFARRRGFPR